jgi:hypothetical protein
LIQEVNQVYDAAVAEATEKLKELKPEEITRENVKRILEEVVVAFSGKFNELAEPFRKAMVESYDEGKKEASYFLLERKK